MKILFVANQINNHGGVARVTSVKANYFIEHFGYEVYVITQNKGHVNPFYHFNDQIHFFDHEYSATGLNYIREYRSFINNIIRQINPNVLVVCDNGLKAFLIPFLVKYNLPLVFEMHGSRYNFDSKTNRLFKFFTQTIKRVGLKKYDVVVALSPENATEWNLKNQVIIPNPIWFSAKQLSLLNSNKVVMLSRNSYEKGIDRVLQIWKKLIQIHPKWELHIYGDGFEDKKFLRYVTNFNFNHNVCFHSTTNQVESILQSASILIMTSRVEGFPMTIIEAMESGLPVVAYDCPVGPRSLIQDSYNGFLIQDNAENEFVNKLSKLISQEYTRKQMGKNAHESVQKYQLDHVMEYWKLFFEQFTTIN